MPRKRLRQALRAPSSYDIAWSNNCTTKQPNLHIATTVSCRESFCKLRCWHMSGELAGPTLTIDQRASGAALQLRERTAVGVAVPARRSCPDSDAAPGLVVVTRAATPCRRSATSAAVGYGNVSRCGEDSSRLRCAGDRATSGADTQRGRWPDIRWMTRAFIHPDGDLLPRQAITAFEPPVFEADIAMRIERAGKLRRIQHAGEDLVGVGASQHAT